LMRTGFQKKSRRLRNLNLANTDRLKLEGSPVGGPFLFR
jgi:hypothetical protein